MGENVTCSHIYHNFFLALAHKRQESLSYQMNRSNIGMEQFIEIVPISVSLG